MTAIVLKEIETLVMNVKPHPLEVEKGDFGYWTNIATLAGIDLVEESNISVD
tara:strand:- start:344 stop:499 length:156 start_codon:yes stop_codon:yes gene_type:complete